MLGDGQPYKGPASTVGNYRLVWTSDTAHVQPELPPTPPEGADDAALAEWKAKVAAALEAFDTARRVARETNNWAALLKPEGKPTYFVMRWLPEAVLMRWEDKRRASGGRWGPREALTRLLLIALHSVEGMNVVGFPVELPRVFDAELGGYAVAESFLDDLRNVLKDREVVQDLVGELAAGVLAQESKTRPL